MNNIEKKLRTYRENRGIRPDEQSIQETIRKSIETYCFAEQKHPLTNREFLWTQLRMIQKRWWLFQSLLLLLLWFTLPWMQNEQLTQRVFGVAATLFMILIVPELWKNRTCQAMEIEAAAYYSLKQIYAARMLLFGIVDIVFITLFCGLTTASMNILFSQLLVQFLFPMAVTAAICFGILCSKYAFSAATAIMMCIVWNAVWLIIILNEKLYAAITFPLWLAFIGIAFVFLAFTIYQTLHCCNHYWEVNSNGTCIK